MLADLREESRIRLKALRERPPPGSIPSQFLALSPRTRHAIAVDTSKSRLYLFENSAEGLKLIADYYISIGKSGIEKSLEGDQRTPLGVYYITSNLDPKSLKDFYGSGPCRSTTPTRWTSAGGKPVEASGCTARRRASSRARPKRPTAAWCWPTPIWSASSAPWRFAPPRL
jgi:hypothetical protein